VGELPPFSPGLDPSWLSPPRSSLPFLLLFQLFLVWVVLFSSLTSPKSNCDYLSPLLTSLNLLAQSTLRFVLVSTASHPPILRPDKDVTPELPFRLFFTERLGAGRVLTSPPSPSEAFLKVIMRLPYSLCGRSFFFPLDLCSGPQSLAPFHSLLVGLPTAPLLKKKPPFPP